jgi:hypothetical protein
MNCRRHGSKPTLALWMLVAVADIAILAATAGALVLALSVVGLLAVAAVVAAGRVLPGRGAPEPEAVVRRRA